MSRRRHAFDADEPTTAPERRISRTGLRHFAAMYEERRGRTTDTEYAWCVVCGKNRIDAIGEYNTCADCLSEQ